MTPSLAKAIEALKKGNFVIVIDDESRENEGDLILAAEKATPEALAFMIRHTTGILCLSMQGNRLDQLHLPPMVRENTDRKQTAFTISVDSRHGITTGVSAADRTKTILTLIDPNTTPEDLCRPGHIFPLRYESGGVLKRAGHTEAAVDLMSLAQLYPAGVIGELIHDDGTMMRMPELKQFAAKHAIPMITIADIIRCRLKQEKLVKQISSARLPTPYGEFTAFVYENTLDHEQHFVLVKGEVKEKKEVLVRVHSECLTGDVFGSMRCDCGAQLSSAMKKIAERRRSDCLFKRT